MIEINLLPEEYRRPEGNYLPMALTVSLGVIVVGSLIAYLIILKSNLQGLEKTQSDVKEDLKKWTEQATKIDKINGEINKYKNRQQTIINISQNKIMWSQKLIQLSNIFARFNDFWLQGISMTQSGTSGTLRFNCFALGKEYKKVTAFRTYIRQDPTFFYHFSTLTSNTISQTGDQMSFPVSLQLKAKAGKRRRR